MEPRHPPALSPATQAQSCGHSSPAATDYESEYTEKHSEQDAYPPKDSTPTDGAAKASNLPHASHCAVSPLSPTASAPPSPISSLSSSHAARNHRLSYPAPAHLDPEKAVAYDVYEHRSQNRRSVPDAPAVVYDKSEYHEKGAEDKAWQLLFYLSGPCALLSLAIAFWSIVAILVSLALYPLRFCSARPALSAQLTAFLAPALNLQLHLVYSFDASESYSLPMLLIIHLFSPMIALGVAIASWTAAAFWFFSCILGDPGGHDGGRHNDGKDCILGVRNYWERWLSRGLR